MHFLGGLGHRGHDGAMRSTLPSLLALALLPFAAAACDKLGLHGSESSGDGSAAASASGGAATGPTTLLGGASSLAFLGSLEGEVDGFTRKAGAQPATLTALVKAGRVRMDVPEGMGPGPMSGAGWGISADLGGEEGHGGVRREAAGGHPRPQQRPRPVRDDASGREAPGPARLPGRPAEQAHEDPESTDTVAGYPVRVLGRLE